MLRQLSPSGARKNIDRDSRLLTYPRRLQSRWLAGVAEGSIQLPARAELEADVARQQAWWERSPFPRSNNYIWALHGAQRQGMS